MHNRNGTFLWFNKNIPIHGISLWRVMTSSDLSDHRTFRLTAWRPYSVWWHISSESLWKLDKSPLVPTTKTRQTIPGKRNWIARRFNELTQAWCDYDGGVEVGKAAPGDIVSRWNEIHFEEKQCICIVWHQNYMVYIEIRKPWFLMFLLCIDLR